MWESVLLVLAGGAIPTFNSWLKRRDDRKKLELERKDKYKLVAIDKRLEAQQKAFICWTQLILIIHEKELEKKDKVIQEAHTFWNGNCLYLEKATRKGLLEIISRVSNHSNLVEIWRQEERDENKVKASNEVKDNWNAIMNLGNIIQVDVEMEPMAFKPQLDAEGNEK